MSTKVIPIIKSPSECSSVELDDFVNLVKSEEEVMDGLEDRIKKIGEKLIFLYQSDILAGTAAVKRPYERYRSGVFRKAKASFTASDFPFELGWIVVHPDFRRCGFAKILIREAMITVGLKSAFATARKDNKSIHKCLESQGFSLCGRSYPSTRHKGHLVLFIKE